MSYEGTNAVLRSLLAEEREARDKVFAFLVAENQRLRDERDEYRSDGTFQINVGKPHDFRSVVLTEGEAMRVMALIRLAASEEAS